MSRVTFRIGLKPRIGRFGILLALALTVPGIALPPLAWAQQRHESSNLADQSLADLMNIRVYGASRYSQPASDAPVSVTVVTRDEISKAGYRTLADILQGDRKSTRLNS